ncbi:DinB family protein [Streptomyces sp. NPDC059783]|uniref:DinB family protein n=1 Tax=Streptomyces sp. NPDC059783 TaxID=3346944 RepID=UPI003661FF99
MGAPGASGRLQGEHDTLADRLRDQRRTLELKCSGLDPEAMARRAVEPSPLSLLGLVRHLAGVEAHWFRRVMAGRDEQRPYRTEADRDAAFTGAVADPAVVAEAWATWRAEVAFAERFVTGAPGPGTRALDAGASKELRWVLVHMIEEYARHNGHADLLRERIDGDVG